MALQSPVARVVVAVAIAFVAGLFIGYRDLRADDVQLAVALVLLTAAVCSALAGRYAWLIAIAVGAGIPIMHAWAHVVGRPVAYQTPPFALLLPLIPAFVGAYVSAGARAIFAAG